MSHYSHGIHVVGAQVNEPAPSKTYTIGMFAFGGIVLALFVAGAFYAVGK